MHYFVTLFVVSLYHYQYQLVTHVTVRVYRTFEGGQVTPLPSEAAICRSSYRHSRVRDTPIAQNPLRFAALVRFNSSLRE